LSATVSQYFIGGMMPEYSNYDRRFATLPDVVKYYDSVFKLRLTD
jgi:hypothetical protein